MSILEVDNLTKTFGGLIAIKDLSFKLEKGEILGIIGPNGAGKTTLFNLITGFYKPNEGRIIYNGENITGLRPYQICKKGITRTFQITQPFMSLTVLENVKIGAYNRISSNQEATKEALKILDLVGLYDKRNEIASSLPVGHRKSLELAKALATKPEVLLLDEVISGLNPKETNDVILNINKIHRKGVTILLIEHVMKVIMSLAQRIIVIHYGKKLAEGTPQEISKNPKVIEAYLGEEYKIVESQ